MPGHRKSVFKREQIILTDAEAGRIIRRSAHPKEPLSRAAARMIIAYEAQQQVYRRQQPQQLETAGAE